MTLHCLRGFRIWHRIVCLMEVAQMYSDLTRFKAVLSLEMRRPPKHTWQFGNASEAMALSHVVQFFYRSEGWSINFCNLLCAKKRLLDGMRRRTSKQDALDECFCPVIRLGYGYSSDLGS